MARKSRATKRSGSSQDIRLSFTLDKDKIEAIQQCLKKGKLTITVSSIAALQAGRARAPYIYD